MNSFRLSSIAAAVCVTLVAACDGGSSLTTTSRTLGDSTLVPSGDVTHPDGAIAERKDLGDHPFGIAVSSEGTIYIGRPYANRLERVDLPGSDFTGGVSVGDIPTAIAFGPAGDRAYVTNQWSQSVGIIDVASNVQVAAVTVPGDPFVLAVAPDGGTVYASTNVGGVHAIDAVADTIVASWSFKGPINGLAFHPDGVRLYAVVQFGYDQTPGEIEEIDTRTQAVLRTIAVPDAGDLQGIAVSPDGSELYVADEYGPLHVLELDGGTQVATVPGAQGGFGLALTRDGTQLYMSTSYGGVVYVVDRAGRSLLKTIETGGRPRRIVFDLTGTTAVIPNEDGWVDFVK